MRVKNRVWDVKMFQPQTQSRHCENVNVTVTAASAAEAIRRATSLLSQAGMKPGTGGRFIRNVDLAAEVNA